MTDSERLRAMAAYIRKHGFSPEVGGGNGPRCFVGAWSSVADECISILRTDAGQMLREIVVDDKSVGAGDLIRAGWTEGCTDDAAAACEIAADLCE